MNKYLVLIIMLLSCRLATANNNMIIEHYSVENGVPHEIVNCAIKDSDGFVWFGTWYGLCSFDGQKFKTYNSRNEYYTDIPPRKIQKIIEDKSSNLWVKTIDHKLYLFDKHKECFYSVFNELRKKYSVNSQIIKIQKTEDGELLLLTKNKDLLKASSDRNGKINIILLHDSKNKAGNTKLKNNLLCESKDYISWIGMDYKILSCPKGRSLKSQPSDFILRKIGLVYEKELSCAYQNKGVLWLGDKQGKIYLITLYNGRIIPIKILQGKGVIENIQVEDRTKIYISVANKGVYLYDLKKKTFKLLFSSQIKEPVVKSFSDSFGKIWFVMGNKGVIYYNPLNNENRQFIFPDGLVNEDIQELDGKEHGMFFITSSGDLARIDHNKLTLDYLNHSEEFLKFEKGNRLCNILLDREGVLWVTSLDNGIYKISFPKKQFSLYSPCSFENKSLDAEICKVGVKALFEAKNGDIWVGTRNSEVYWLARNGALKRKFSEANYNIGNVYHIMEDNRGNLWFSTKGQGLVKAEPDNSSSLGFRFTRFVNDENNPSSISSNEVYCSFLDSKGRIWAGLFGGGLNLLKVEHGKVVFKHKYNCFKYYPSNGMYMEIRNMIEDSEGRIWVGTSDGLMSFDGNFKRPDQIKFEIYQDGSDIADNDIYALYKDKKAQIWVSVFGGGLNKLICYDHENRKPVFQSYGLKEGLKSDVILSIVEDGKSNLWLATEMGISRFDSKNQSFRNFDRYDGFIPVKMEEESALRCASGQLWFGCKDGILKFNPFRLQTYNFAYKTFIVDFKISNQDINSLNEGEHRQSVKELKTISLKHNQSMFTIEFAALNYYNQNRISYKYILQGYEEEWHFSGKNRIASYTNVPPGKYLFRVKTIDEANPSFVSERTMEIIILPPWWRTNIAYAIYAILFLALLYGVVKFVFFMIKIKNDIYIEQKLSELKIKFFTNISHELRTPLTLIKGPIQELREKEKLSDKGTQYIDLMEKSTDQMLNLVNQILDFRKIQNGKMRLHVSLINLNSVIENLSKEFIILSEENEISYTCHFDDDDIFVWADKEKLEIVIRNLLSNAFKFTSSGGSILLTAGLLSDGKGCFIKVEDTGTGIPQNKLTEIFERFSQGDNAKDSTYKGTGIGLALSKELINLHHGNITVESEQSKGSVFTVELLLGKDHFKPSEVDFYFSDQVDVLPQETSVLDTNRNEEEDELDENLKKENSALPSLLLVEDNKDLCNLIKMQLEDKFRIFIANNGVEGLKKVHLYHPDIVVTDQMMPEMDGTEMLQRIRKDFKISHIPVVILTAKGGDEAKTTAISLGANAYITKPFSKDYLVARIEQLLKERKNFQERLWKKDNDEPSVDYEQFLVQKDVQLLEKIHQVIEENLDNSDFNIDTIAATIGLGRSSFFKKLKSLTGLAPVDLVKEIRLGKSIEMIKNTDLSISEIAFAVGFKDVGYFGKCFRKKYDQSPREYMNTYRKS
jgi:signal transduction histidine kinase/ligand-binding sensor domain-containing protein/DNA-binding response OmpR family regulator